MKGEDMFRIFNPRIYYREKSRIYFVFVKSLDKSEVNVKCASVSFAVLNEIPDF
jgi:hypothetical protein